MSDFPPPPPAPPRNPARVSSANTPAPATGWKANLKTKGKAFGKVAYEKSWKWSDAIGGKVNDYAEKAGSERFWPTTGDFQQELDKCERILHTFTVDGVATTVDAADPDNTSTKKKKPVKVLRKIPPEVIQQAVGLAIYTNFRTAIAPFGGSSGTGMVVARLPDGTWSPPSSISPNNYAAGLVYGVDIFDAIVVIRTQKALESFYTHKATLGADIGVVAGPFGAGAVAEVGKERAPVFSYVKSRGLYAGVSILGQIFVERFEENGAMYHWPGVKAKDILTGKVRMPVEAAGLMKQLKDSETGKAQREKGDGLDIVVPEGVDQLDLQEGEVLKLPPTPDMVDPEVGDDDPEASVISRRSSASHTAPRAMPPPLPKRFQSNISSASEYSEPERPETGYTPAAIEHTNAYPISGIDMGGVGINEMDESTRLEHEQYLQALKESEAEHAALQNDKRHSNSTISGPPEYHSDVAPPTNPHVLASDADLQSGMSNLNVNATPVIPQETVYQAQHADDPYDLR